MVSTSVHTFIYIASCQVAFVMSSEVETSAKQNE